jgi:hypothetical protein
MRRLIALIVLCAGLLGVGSPVIACATAAAGDCCPAGAGSGCSPGFQQLDPAATACCLAGNASSPAMSAEFTRGVQALARDGGSDDPVALVSTCLSLPQRTASSAFAAAIVQPKATDRSLTYLRTGRLRL